MERSGLCAGASTFAFLILASPVGAQAVSPAGPPESTAGAPAPAVSEIIVTGTRTVGLRAVDSPAPIQLVGAGAFKQVGQPSLTEGLAQNVPSFEAQEFGTDLANITLAARLRGLSANETLVLVDGKRRHPTSNIAVNSGPFQGSVAPDLSLIPVDQIDHVEVLTDGAAAQYGSDAIGGVVNIILKHSDSAGLIDLTGGQFYRGEGGTGDLAVNKGFALGQNGFLNVTGEVRTHQFTQLGGSYVGLSNPDGSLLPGVPASFANLPGYPRVDKIVGDAAYNLYNLFYNAGYDLGGGFQAYSFGSYSHRRAQSFENYRPPNRIVASSVLGVAGTYGSPTALVFAPVGFNPIERIDENDYSFTAGVKGQLAGFSVDLSTTYGDDKNDISTVSSANSSLFIDTHSSPKKFRDGFFDSSQWTSNLDFTRPIEIGLATPLNVAFGGEARRDEYTIGAGDAASIYKEGAQGFPGFQPTDAGTHSRTAYAGYVDLSVHPITPLLIDLAGRFESYSDFGDTTNGKITARYDFSPAFALRGTVSSGFRAPTLAEEYYSSTNVSPSFAIVQLPPDSPAAQLVGFPRLKPEKSTNYSFGFVSHPLARLTVTADAYQIDVTNRIVASGNLLGQIGSTVVSQGVLQAIAAHGNILDPTVTYVGTNLFTNGADTRTRGVEVTATYASQFAFGHADWTLGFNYNDTKVTRVSVLPPAVGGGPLLSTTAISDLQDAAPKFKLILNGLFTHGPLTVNLRETIYGETSERVSPDGTGSGPNAVTNRIPVTGITDLDFGFRISRGLVAHIGANNLFDVFPRKRVDYPALRTTSDGGTVYGVPAFFSPFGVDGGYYYGRITYAF